MSGGSRCVVCKIVSLLVIIGALNWGLIGLFQLDVVARLLGPMSGPSRVVYGLVGLAGIMSILAWFKQSFTKLWYVKSHDSPLLKHYHN